MKYIIHIIGWGYYAGRNEKYADMFNISSKKFAKRFYSIEEAEKVAEARRKGGYMVEIERIAE